MITSGVHTKDLASRLLHFSLAPKLILHYRLASNLLPLTQWSIQALKSNGGKSGFRVNTFNSFGYVHPTGAIYRVQTVWCKFLIDRSEIFHSSLILLMS